MKFRIVYDTPGRIRFRCGGYAFEKELECSVYKTLTAEDFVSSVQVRSGNGGILVCYKKGCRDKVIKAVSALDPRKLVPNDTDPEFGIAEIDRSFGIELGKLVAKRILFTAFLPMPVSNALTIIKGLKYIWKGLCTLGEGKLTVDVLDGASITACLSRKNYKTAGSVMFLLSVSALLEDYTRARTRAVLADSLAVKADKVWLVTEESDVLIPMSELHAGDRIRVRTGSVIPVDGEICEGEAYINESSMTGEPLAVMKSAGSSVFAGTVVEEGTVAITVRSLSSDTKISKIIELIDNSENLKAGVQSRAETLADSIVPFSFLGFGLTLLLTGNITKAVSLLMVDYSCAIKLATPISVISAMKEAAARKIMIKGGKFMELFAKTDTIVFDKTGTLTSACPQVTQIIPLSDCSREYILKTAACLEEHFPHSVARAVVRKALEEGLHHEEEHAEVEYIVAHGISSRLHGKKVLVGSYHFLFEDERIPLTEEQRLTIRNHARGKSNIFLAIGRRAIGMIGVSDPPRPEAAETIARLKRQGISSIIMLTGDSESAARAISRQLGITEYRSQVLPEDKARFIQQLKKSGKTVCMVGDGINDSPALSCADVSVSMKDSSDIAREVADISLLSSSLAELVVLRELSCAVLEKIERNYRFIIGFNSSLILLGMFGLITPDLSAFLHNASTVYVSARSTRRCLPPVRVPK